MSYVPLLDVAELAEGGQKACRVGLTSVLLLRHQDTVYAVENICPHARQPLEGGQVDAGSIVCPKHGARFDLLTGDPGNGVCRRPLRVFPARVNDGVIEVALD